LNELCSCLFARGCASFLLFVLHCCLHLGWRAAYVACGQLTSFLLGRDYWRCPIGAPLLADSSSHTPLIYCVCFGSRYR
jgi:hypothetical protein